jgi:hypothetical protein
MKRHEKSECCRPKISEMLNPHATHHQYRKAATKSFLISAVAPVASQRIIAFSLYRTRRFQVAVFSDCSLSNPVGYPRERPEEESFIRRCLAPGECVIDVGANIGSIVLAAASAVGPSGSVKRTGIPVSAGKQGNS